MRFTDKNKQEQLNALVRLHDKLNDGLFDGELERGYYVPPSDEWGENSWTPPTDRRIEISIGGAGNSIDFSACASYHKDSIIFDARYIKYVLIDLSEDEQFNVISTVMLHEMIHQYIYEKGIKDTSPHGNKFKQECKRHGLYRHTVLNGDDIRETIDELMPAAQAVLDGFSL